LKDDPEALKAAFLKTMSYVSSITIPLGLGLMLVSKPFVLTVFTNKWSEAIPVMRAIALYALFLSLAYNATHAYKARGAILLMTSISTVRAVILIPALWWASSQIGSIEAIAWTHAAIAFIGCIINIIMAGRVMNASLASIIRTLRSPLIAGAVMSIVVLGFLYITSSLFPWVQLIIGIATGVLSYTAILAWIQKDIFMEIWLMFRTSISPQPKLNQ
jgi:O-antigen/teichoic acid export membrane protein